MPQQSGKPPSLCVRSICKHQFTDRRAHHSRAGLNKLAVCPSQLEQHSRQTVSTVTPTYYSTETLRSDILDFNVNVVATPLSLSMWIFSSLQSQSGSGRCVTLLCEWQLSCFKLPIDLVSHELAHGPWREAFVCSQPCTLPICCWDGLQCCHHPHQQQENLCFLHFSQQQKCQKLVKAEHQTS